MGAEDTPETEDEMETHTGRDVVLALGEDEADTVAIPAELVPEAMRRDGQLRVVASVDRTGLLGAG